MKHSTIKIISWAIIVLFAAAVISLVTGLIVDYNAGTLSAESIYSHARLSFLLILAGTLASLFMLILLNFGSKQKDDSESLPFTDDILPDSDSADNSAESDASPVFESEKIDDSSDVSLKENSDEDFKDPLADSSLAEESDTLSNDSISFADDTESFSETKDAQQSPSSVSSPSSSLHNAEGLESILDEELVHAASSEQDVSLMIILNLTKPASDDDSAEVKLLEEKCGKQGIIFNQFKNENGQKGYALILKNISLDTAFASAEGIHSALSLYIKNKDPTKDVVLGIGISSRSQRLVSGSRLISEANLAAVHALEDKDSPVIAFRVDPDKYRKYLADHGEAPNAGINL